MSHCHHNYVRMPDQCETAAGRGEHYVTGANQIQLTDTAYESSPNGEHASRGVMCCGRPQHVANSSRVSKTTNSSWDQRLCHHCAISNAISIDTVVEPAKQASSDWPCSR